MPPALSAPALTHLDAASQILISPISCWEVGILIAKGRVRLDRPTRVWVRDLLAGRRVGLAELTADAAVIAAELPGLHGDPADRFLVATAQTLGVPLVTKDPLIHAYAAGRPEFTAIW